MKAKHSITLSKCNERAKDSSYESNPIKSDDYNENYEEAQNVHILPHSLNEMIKERSQSEGGEINHIRFGPQLKLQKGSYQHSLMEEQHISDSHPSRY